jgi:uncharacterized membrane protein YebE (DUF533 family)
LAASDTAAAAATYEQASSTVGQAASWLKDSLSPVEQGAVLAAEAGTVTVMGTIVGLALPVIAVSGVVAIAGVIGYQAYKRDWRGIQTRLHRQANPPGWLP